VRLPAPEAVTDGRLGAIEALGTALAKSGSAGDDATRQFAEGRALAERAGRLKYVARFWSLLGEHRYVSGDLDGALAAQQAAIDVLDTLVAAGGSDVAIDRALAQSDRAEMLLEGERHQEALAAQTAAVAALERQAGAAPEDAAAQRHLAQALVRQGDMQYAVTGDWAASVPLFERALAVFERTHASDKARVDYARDLSIALEHVGDAMLQLGTIDRARALFDRLLELRHDVLARDPGSAEAKRDVAVALERQGDLALAEREVALGRKEPEVARALAGRALASFDDARTLRAGSLAGGDDLDALVLTRDLAVLWSKTGTARFAVGSDQDWRGAYESAIALMAPLVARPDAPPGWRRDLAVFRSVYADALWRRARAAEALAQWTAALALTEAQLATSPDDPRLRADQSLLRGQIARASLK
jgi:tetratricopeptide (TPR) repeat protein